MLNQYPEEMTIVLQHQFANLMIGSTYFEVDLSFGGIPQTLRIPYDSISYFADPHAKFALSFGVSDEIFINTTEINTPEKDQSCADNKKEKQEAIVVSIEEYKKKHA